MRLSRIIRPDNGLTAEEAVPMRRALFWIVVGAVIVSGIVLYFGYARHLTPLLD